MVGHVNVANETQLLLPRKLNIIVFRYFPVPEASRQFPANVVKKILRSAPVQEQFYHIEIALSGSPLQRRPVLSKQNRINVGTVIKQQLCDIEISRIGRLLVMPSGSFRGERDAGVRDFDMDWRGTCNEDFLREC